jgi:cobaltochelatase CobN
MSVAAKTVSGKRAKLYWSDNNPERELGIRTLKEDIEAAVRAKLFNNNWIDVQKDYGYKGAGAVSSRVNNIFKLSATTEQIDKWVFDGVVDTYIRTKENYEWLRDNNIYGLEEITRRLLEAASRGMWQADEETLELVKEAALMVEGDMEEEMGAVTGEFQGGKVTILTTKDVEKWDQKWKMSNKVPAVAE